MDTINSFDESFYENYITTPYGFQERGTYIHGSKHSNIQAVTYNTKISEHIVVDSRGVTGWVKNIIDNYTHRLLEFQGHKCNGLRDILHCRSLNLYFALSRDFDIRVYNINFIELYSHKSDGHTISCIAYNEKNNELMTIGRNHIRFWKYSFSPSGHQSMILLREIPTKETNLVGNAIFDPELQRIYLLCDHEVFCYNTDGKCLFQISNRNTVYLSTCAFSKEVNVLITGALNGQIDIYSTTGKLVCTLLNHTRVVTSLLIHPFDGSMFISSSIDGTIKVFSLDTLDELFSIIVFPDGIFWMKLQSSYMLYCASRKCVQLYDLNYTFKFWGTLRCPVKSLEITKKQCLKSRQVIAYTMDDSVRIYSKASGQKKCTLLPPPELSVLKSLQSMAYDRIGGIIYLLFDCVHLWIYSKRTDPATRVASWNIQQIVEKYNHRCDFKKYSEQANGGFGKSSFSLNQVGDGLDCRCLCTVSECLQMESQNVCFLKKSNENLAMQAFSFLLCGMSNGDVHILHPSLEGFVFSSFKAHSNCPVIKIDAIQKQITTLIKTIEGFLVRCWTSENLTMIYEIDIPKNFTSIASIPMLMAVGCSDGMLHVKSLEEDFKVKSAIKSSEDDAENIENKDHTDSILSVDITEEKQLICSCGRDHFIRIWTLKKILLQEILFDASLCYGIFLDGEGTILMGFKSHLFTVPLSVLQIHKQSSDSDTSEDESFIYEDPLVFSDHAELTETTLRSYLVPYPYLNLEASWMLPNTLSHDIYSDDQESDDSVTVSISSSEIYAPTEIYQDTECSDMSRANSQLFQFPKCDILSDESAEELSDAEDNKVHDVIYKEIREIDVVVPKASQIEVKKEYKDKEISKIVDKSKKIGMAAKVTEMNTTVESTKQTVPSPKVEKKQVKALHRKQKIKSKSSNTEKVQVEEKENKTSQEVSKLLGQDHIESQASAVSVLSLKEEAYVRPKGRGSSLSPTTKKKQSISQSSIKKPFQVKKKKRSAASRKSIEEADFSKLKNKGTGFLTAMANGQFEKGISQSFHNVFGSLMSKGSIKLEEQNESPNLQLDDNVCGQQKLVEHNKLETTNVGSQSPIVLTNISDAEKENSYHYVGEHCVKVENFGNCSEFKFEVPILSNQVLNHDNEECNIKTNHSKLIMKPSLKDDITHCNTSANCILTTCDVNVNNNDSCQTKENKYDEIDQIIALSKIAKRMSKENLIEKRINHAVLYHTSSTNVIEGMDKINVNSDGKNVSQSEKLDKQYVVVPPDVVVEHQPVCCVTPTSDHLDEAKSQIMQFIVGAFRDQKSKSFYRRNNENQMRTTNSSTSFKQESVQSLQHVKLDDYDGFSSRTLSPCPNLSVPKNSVESISPTVISVQVHHVEPESVAEGVANSDVTKSNHVLFEKLRKRRNLQAKERRRCQSVQLMRSESESSKSRLEKERCHSTIPSRRSKERLSVRNSPIPFLSSSSSSNLTFETTSWHTDFSQSSNISKKDIIHMKRMEKLKNLEHKLSGQPHRFHINKTKEEYQNNGVALLYLQGREKGVNILPIKKSSISIPSRHDQRKVEQDIYVDTLIKCNLTSNRNSRNVGHIS